jgi:hypothetical protein
MTSRYTSPLFKELQSLQALFPLIDIITITGFMNDKQFETHVKYYREQAKKQ